jgi:hypothetical protein
MNVRDGISAEIALRIPPYHSSPPPPYGPELPSYEPDSSPPYPNRKEIWFTGEEEEATAV